MQELTGEICLENQFQQNSVQRFLVNSIYTYIYTYIYIYIYIYIIIYTFICIGIFVILHIYSILLHRLQKFSPVLFLLVCFMLFLCSNCLFFRRSPQTRFFSDRNVDVRKASKSCRSCSSTYK